MRIAIIGAGIVGLYLAWKLSEKGHKLVVFEKREKIGKEICSGLFSERILDFIPESKNLIENQITSTFIHFPKRTLKIKFSRKFLVMSHYQLDRLVASLAEKSGAKIILNFNLRRSVLGELEKEFERIIGSDGVNSFVRKSLGLPDPDLRLGIQGFTSKEQVFISEFSKFRNEKYNKNLKREFSQFYGINYVETWPTSYGFLWKIPRGKEIEWGIIERPKRARVIFEQFLKDKEIQLSNLKSTFVPQGLIIPHNQKITLCGDASGLTKPWSGGGVIWGLLAAQKLLKNFPDFLKYKKEVQKFFSRKILFSKMITSLVYFLGFKMPWLLPKNWQIESDFLI